MNARPLFCVSICLLAEASARAWGAPRLAPEERIQMLVACARVGRTIITQVISLSITCGLRARGANSER